VSSHPGILYVVATPIGNLGDITVRAQQILSSVDFVAAEDTRRTLPLLNHLGISKPLVALHEHNERQRIESLLDRIVAGENMALVSDAGTPLISDPGYHLVRQARQRGIMVSPIPGVSALVAALSVSGLPTDHFRFEGFLPHKRNARRACLQALVKESVTLVFYESSHRILAAVEDMCEILGNDREAILARELTKVYETVLGYNLQEILTALQNDSNQSRGEFVVIVKGVEAKVVNHDAAETDRLIALLLAEMPLKSVSRVVSQYTGLAKNDIYQKALHIQKENESE